jgi:hypothetical protein
MRTISACLAVLALAAGAAAADSAAETKTDPAGGAAAAKAHGTITGTLTAIRSPGSGGPSITVTPTASKPGAPLELRVDQAKITIDGNAATFDDLYVDDAAVVVYDGDAAISIAVSHAKPKKPGKRGR